MGGSFTRLPGLTNKTLSGVWVPPHDPFEVYAVGIEGVVLHYERAHPLEAPAAGGHRARMGMPDRPRFSLFAGAARRRRPRTTPCTSCAWTAPMARAPWPW